MNTESVVNEIEAAVAAQLEIAADDPSVEVAARAFLTALRPAIKLAATRLAEQAGAEVAAQLPEYDVGVVIADGEPSLQIRTDRMAPTFATEDLDARLTLRLPPTLKGDLEDAAGEVGDSVNAYVVKALSTRSSRKRYSKHISGTLDT
jgi:hypothetical protein